MKNFITIFVVFVAFAISGCSGCSQPQQPQAVQQVPAQAPIIVQNEGGSHAGDMVAGAAIGAVAANMMNNRSNNRPVIVKKYYNCPAYRPYRSSYRSYSRRR